MIGTLSHINTLALHYIIVSIIGIHTVARHLLLAASIAVDLAWLLICCYSLASIIAGHVQQCNTLLHVCWWLDFRVMRVFRYGTVLVVVF